MNHIDTVCLYGGLRNGLPPNRWTGFASSDCSDARNWSLGRAPTKGDAVVVGTSHNNMHPPPKKKWWQFWKKNFVLECHSLTIHAAAHVGTVEQLGGDMTWSGEQETTFADRVHQQSVDDVTTVTERGRKWRNEILEETQDE